MKKPDFDVRWGSKTFFFFRNGLESKKSNMRSKKVGAQRLRHAFCTKNCAIRTQARGGKGSRKEGIDKSFPEGFG